MTSQNSRSILGNVPFDILVHLLGFLCPLDILAARQTCKLLQEATSQRSLWIGVLRSVCAENHIFWPTYPIKDMSTSDLVKAALTPTRFLSFIFKERDPALEGIEPRTVIHFTPGNLNRLRNPCPIDLLPGGRFLVCAEYKVLSIWDLGCPSEGCSLSEPILVASVATEECNSFILHPTNDAIGIQVVVLSAQANNVTVFEIYPTSSNPSFRKITSLDVVLHEAWEIYCLCGDRLSINYQNIVTVWDFSRNLWASWEVERTPASISATENHVILVEGDHETRVGVWKIPPLHPIGHTSAFHGVLPPDICFTLPQVEDLLSVEYYGGLDDWYLTGAVGWTRCIIDVYVTHLGFRRRSALLRVELPLKLEDAQFTHKDDLDLHTFDFATRENIFGSLGVCNENAVSVWTSPFGIQFHAARRSNVVNRPCTPVDLTPSPRSASVHIRMPLVPEVAAFCAVSGRLCYLLHGDSSNTVYITDCLVRNTSED